MKKTIAILVMLLALVVSSVALAEEPATHVVSIKGFTKVCTAYHQLVAIAVEYDANVAVPAMDAYSVVDYATAEFREAFNRRPFSEAPITAVYTNDVAALREDQTSVEGRFVIIELATIAGTVVEDGINKVAYNAGVCTWRRITDAGEDGADWRRLDFSDLVITQKADVLGTDGAVVSTAGQLPTLQYDELTNFGIDEFVSQYFDLSNGQKMYYSYWLPENYDANKKYPMVVNLTGNGGSYRPQPNGDPTGAHISRDAAAVAWMDAGEDVIILSPQQSNQPYKTTADDFMEIVNYFLENYSVDLDRVYAIGSSAGGMAWSRALAVPEYAAIFAAYVPCNTRFTGAANMFKEEYNVRNAEEVLGFTTVEDYMNPDLWLDDSEYYEAAKEALAAVVDNRINVYVWHGTNDEQIPAANGITTYILLRRMYEEQGLSEEEIDELVKIYLIDIEEMHDLGILSYHMASKVAVSHPELIEWMLSQTKAD